MLLLSLVAIRNQGSLIVRPELATWGNREPMEHRSWNQRRMRMPEFSAIPEKSIEGNAQDAVIANIGVKPTELRITKLA